jgi:Rrf2 family protein
VELYSSKIEYALLALLELARHHPHGEPLQIRQIAAQQEIPDRYLEQLLATLRRGGIVKSQRGAKGGYLLAREPWQITVFDAISALEGEDLDRIDDSANQPLDKAVVAEIWQEVHRRAYELLEGYTLQDLCDRVESRKQLDVMYYI